MQNKPKAELTAALMLLDTRSMSFDMREIDNRRFMFSPQAGELILGRQYRGGQLYTPITPAQGLGATALCPRPSL